VLDRGPFTSFLRVNADQSVSFLRRNIDTLRTVIASEGIVSTVRAITEAGMGSDLSGGFVSRLTVLFILTDVAFAVIINFLAFFSVYSA